MKLGVYNIILRILWLRQHNLDINQGTNKIQFTYCEYIKQLKDIKRDTRPQGTRTGNQVKPKIRSKGKIME